MSQHLIENIKIENFKCFENLEINDFKRVNVFGGKNNVGKTALLEAIELLVKSPDPSLLASNALALLRRRQETIRTMEVDIFRNDSDIISMHSSIRKLRINKAVQLDLLNGDAGSVGDAGVGFIVDDDSLVIPLERFVGRTIPFSFRDRSVNRSVASAFVKSSKLEDNDVSVLYGAIIEADKEKFVNDSLNAFDNTIISLKIIPTDRGSRPKMKLEGRDRLVSLSSLGEGINRYISILCAIWTSQNGFLFIDEIENGIHYSNYKKLWELIFMASEQANCQVFVTSHSKECITAFNEVQQERADNAGNYFELYKSEKKQRIVAAARDAEQLQYALTHDEAIRGE